MVAATLLFAASLLALAVLIHLWRKGQRPLSHDAALPSVRSGLLPFFTKLVVGSALLSGVLLVSLIVEHDADGRVSSAIRVASNTTPSHGAKLQPWHSRCAVKPDALRAMIRKLSPQHAPIGRVRPGDWRASHRERPQSFERYLKGSPTTPTRTRQVLYIVPVGSFPGKHAEVLQRTAEFLSAYFCLPVKVTPPLPLSLVPARARRVHPSWGVKQLLSTYLLDEVLRPRLPKDAVAMLGLTTVDLWPGRGWNFVFGQASLRDRVGVWSIHRNGDPSLSQDSYRRFLLRTLKTATHETGHMLSIHHCLHFSCNMCGSNSRAESDRRPIALCPQCLAKLAWATRCQPKKRYRQLAALCTKYGLQPQAAFYRRLLGAI